MSGDLKMMRNIDKINFFRCPVSLPLHTDSIACLVHLVQCRAPEAGHNAMQCDSTALSSCGISGSESVSDENFIMSSHEW